MTTETPAPAEAAVTERATDPRLEQQPRAPAPAAEPAAAAPAEGETEQPAGAAATPEADQPLKPKKTAEEVLKGRVGHLTKQLSTKDQELADIRSRAEAAEALLNARAAPQEGEAPLAPTPAPAPATAQPGARTYTAAEFEAQVAAKAAADEFNRQADAMYDVGAKAFPDWKDTVDTLAAAGLMNKELLDAALATDNGAPVIHFLGTDLAEAERIAALPPIRKAAEMTKLAARLAAPKSTPISAAPAPITPVKGAPAPSVDLEKASNDMAAYAAARAQQGAPWAQGRAKRA